MHHFRDIEKIIAGRYRVVAPLGLGSMGEVYLAEDLEIRREVALKVLRREWLTHPDVVLRVENECHLMASLGPHPNIVMLFDRIRHEDTIVLVMERLRGNTLAHAIEATRRARSDGREAPTVPLLLPNETGANFILSDDAIRRIMEQCLSALALAHEKGIVHRDVKPSNILLARDFTGGVVAKLTDFGIAKAFAVEGTTAPAAITAHGVPGPGTPAYMAPEQIDPDRFGVVGPSADLYALGVSLYEALALKPPFDGTYTELLFAHVHTEPPDIRALNPAVDAAWLPILQRALQKQPSDRFATAAEFAAFISDTRDRSPHTRLAFDPGSRQPPMPPRRFKYVRPILAIVGAAGVLVGLSAAFTFVASVSDNFSATAEAPPELVDSGTDTVQPEAPQPAATTAQERSAGAQAAFREIRYRWVAPGTFVMGGNLLPADAVKRFGGITAFYEDEFPARDVTITRGFWMAECETTVHEFEQFILATGYRTDAEREGWGFALDLPRQDWTRRKGVTWRTRQSPDLPVAMVSWNDAMAYCEWLSSEEGVPHRLPTEAEWEFACRAGTDSLFSWGDDFRDGVAFLNAADLTPLPNGERWGNHAPIQDGFWHAAPVGTFRPNAWGLHDMLGNAWEWCADWYAPYENAALVDPAGPPTGEKKLARGGSWCYDHGDCRAGNRYAAVPDRRAENIGFRVLREQEPADGEILKRHAQAGSRRLRVSMRRPRTPSPMEISTCNLPA